MNLTNIEFKKGIKLNVDAAWSFYDNGYEYEDECSLDWADEDILLEVSRIIKKMTNIGCMPRIGEEILTDGGDIFIIERIMYYEHLVSVDIDLLRNHEIRQKYLKNK